jgi:hypothetical protein
LSKRLDDELENRRNLFRQILSEQSTNTEKHSLIQQINQWENQVKQLLLKYTVANIEMKWKINK